MRAQVTVFIIIGILVIIAFGITVYVGSAVRENIESKPTQQRLEQAGVQPIVDYVSTCLSLASQDALSLAARQGGLIYELQGGVAKDFTEGEGVIFTKYSDDVFGVIDVPFLIRPPSGNVGQLFFAQPPRYPFDSFPYTGDGLLFTGYYGVSDLPSLYKTTPDGVPVAGSMQESVEKYVQKKVVECADFKSFLDKDYRVTQGSPVASLLFASKQEQFAGEQFVTMELKWPLEVRTPGGDSSIVEEFAVRIPVRLAAMYYMVKKIVDTDVTDISYVPDSEGQFVVTKLPFGSDSFISVSDQQSIVGGKPFEFRVLRKNRIPALWRIDTAPLEQVEFHVTPEGRGAVVRAQGDTLHINDPCQEAGVQNPFLLELNASDADEDAVVFDVHVPGGSDGQIPRDAVGIDFSVTVLVKDAANLSRESFDSQEIPLRVALCEVR
ncbi:hypothetical protein J4219_08420 [Candidatus Woesearchaeota archaeon]|nr:hypothetical protein [Candidatus Woesearchaeota archaeon]